MSKSILLLLLLIDITVPILACIILSTIFQSTALFEFMLFGLISGILFFIFQLINSDYDNFYLSHLNQKLRLTAISWIKVSFIISLYLLIFVLSLQAVSASYLQAVFLFHDQQDHAPSLLIVLHNRTAKVFHHDQSDKN